MWEKGAIAATPNDDPGAGEPLWPNRWRGLIE